MNIKPLITTILFIIITTLSSCGLPFLSDDQKVGEKRQFSTTDPAFNSYTAKFEQDGRNKTGDQNFIIGDIPINFGDTEDANHQGICVKYSDGSSEIIIRKAWWDTQTDQYRESLIYHELGHCRLGRGHDNTTTTQKNVSYKTSMMNQYIIGPALYTTYKDAYLDELFNNSSVQIIIALSN